MKLKNSNGEETQKIKKKLNGDKTKNSKGDMT